MIRRAACVAASLTLAGAAHAEEPEPDWSPGEPTTSRMPGEVASRGTSGSGDGVYGRFDGRFDAGLEAGAELGNGGTAFAARATAHYFYMAGVYTSYFDSMGSDELPSRRGVSFGVDLRPTFLPRWSNDMQHGPSMLDLAVDSISLGMGVYFREPHGHEFGDSRGFELSLGFAVPLFAHFDGLWLGARGLLRWDDPKARDARGAEATALLTLGYQWTL